MPDLIVPPPPALADCVQHALLKTLPGGPYCLPAGLHPLFLLILRGGISVCHAGGETPLPPFLLSGGTRGIRRARARPGTRILTVSLQAGCLRQLLPLPALAVMETAVAVTELLNGEARGEARLLEDMLADGERHDEQRVLATLFECLLRWRQRQPPHAGFIIPPAALGLPLAELADHAGLGPRQFERRFLASYGQPLKYYRRQARCSRLCAHWLLRPPAAQPDEWVNLADLAVQAGYYDQAHLHHDLLEFTGHTPSALLAGIAGNDPAFWPYRLDRVQLARLFGPAGY